MPPETDNLRLEELFRADQQDREKVYDSPQAVLELSKRDQERRREVLELISQGQVNTANDLYRAALLFQHGAETKDFILAHRLAVMGAVNGHRPSRWLAAASLDRLLLSLGLAQVYGTQFERSPEEKRYQLRLPIDDASLLHFEKHFFDVPPVPERLAQLNRRLGA